MKIACLIQCHKEPELINKFLEVMKHPELDFFIHIDKKSVHVKDFLKVDDNVFILPDFMRVDVKWGQFSQVEATLNLIKAASMHDNYDFYLLCSGQDYPIKPINSLINYLKRNSDFNFLNFIDSKNYNLDIENNFDKRNKIFFPRCLIGQSKILCFFKNLYIVITGGYNHTFRFFLRRCELKSFFGSSWWCLNGCTIKWMRAYLNNNPDYIKYFYNCLCPDESFFQTLFMMSPYKNKVKDYLHYIIFNKNNARLLDINDYSKLINSKYFFARKFSIKDSESLIKKIDDSFRRT